MKLALHRSITFWSGILVMAFIGWAWWDSMRYTSYLSGGEWHGASSGRVLWVNRHPVGKTGWASGRNPNGDPWLIRLHYVPSFLGPPRKTDPPKELPGPVFVWATQKTNINGYIREWKAASGTGGKLQAAVNVQGPGSWLLYLPHWLILLAFAIPWSALLLWRARRRKRAVRLVIT